MTDVGIDCGEARLALGAYVLASLEPAEHQTITRHVERCERCRVEARELAATAAVLAHVPSAALTAPEPAAPPVTPSTDLFERIVASVDAGPVRPQRRSRRTTWAMAAAASIVLLVSAGAVVEATRPEHHAATTTTARASAGGIQLTVIASDARSGTRLDIDVAGLPNDERCHLVAVATDGTRHDAGTWNATYDGHAELTESTDVPRAQLRRLTLYGRHGRRLVSLAL